MRTLRKAVFLLGFVVAAPSAHADANRIRNGSPIHLRLAGRREAAVGLRPGKSGWRVVLRAPGAESAELSDVTPGRATSKFRVPVTGREVILDAERFVAGHAYRLEVHGGERQLLYLYPPLGRRVSTLVFDAEEPTAGDDLSPSDKGSL